MKGIITSFLVCILVLTTQSCEDKNTLGPDLPTDNFDRKALLTDMADNVIIPGYIAYINELDKLEESSKIFGDSPTTDALSQLRLDFLEAYIAWQRVSMFEIGKAEEISLRNKTNIFPASVSQIIENIETAKYNLDLPSTIDEQGFPAIEYLIYGTGQSEIDVTLYFLNNQNSVEYLNTLISRLHRLSFEVLNDWQLNYRESFIANDGSSATSSLNKLVNDYLFYYEKFLRAGKIGIPAGIFSGNTLPNKVEGFYSEENSKLLFLEGLKASKAFFHGTSNYTDEVGESIKSYLNYLDQDGNDLSGKIMAQFDVIESKATGLENNFADQIESDNIKMLETYDELQKNVILLKVDMLQALNIKVDFVDADGD